MDFFQKRWVRIVGIVPMSVYTFLAVMAVAIVLNSTIYRPPNQVFPMTDLIGWIGYLFFLSIIGASGILAIATAYFMKGIFKVLYFSGILAMLASVAYLPLSLTFNADVDFHPQIPGPQFVIGKWMDNGIRLELKSDSTYVMNSKTGFIFSKDSETNEGRWRLDKNYLYLDGLDSNRFQPWEVVESDGYYFILYYVPENFDAWSGYLGLMREKDWLDSR